MDFGPPDHTVDAAPALDTGEIPRKGPSRVLWGAPLVTGSGCGLRDPALSLGEARSQLVFDVGKPFPSYRIELDLCLTEQEGGGVTDPPAAIYVDVPEAQQIWFTEDGDVVIRTRALREDRREVFAAIGTYTPNEPMHLRVGVDIADSRWRLEKDGALLFSGPLSTDRYPAEALESVRVAVRGAASNSIAIDDVSIVGSTAALSRDGSPPAPRVLALDPICPLRPEKRFPRTLMMEGPYVRYLVDDDGQRVALPPSAGPNAVLGIVRRLYGPTHAPGGAEFVGEVMQQFRRGEIPLARLIRLLYPERWCQFGPEPLPAGLTDEELRKIFEEYRHCRAEEVWERVMTDAPSAPAGEGRLFSIEAPEGPNCLEPYARP